MTPQPQQRWVAEPRSLSPCTGSPGGREGWADTHIGVAFHTKDLFQEGREAGEDPDAGPKAQRQDEVSLVPHQLEGKGLLSLGATNGGTSPMCSGSQVPEGQFVGSDTGVRTSNHTICRGSDQLSRPPSPPQLLPLPGQIYLGPQEQAALTSFSPSRNFSEVELAAAAEGGVGGTFSQRHAVASRQAMPAGIT